MRFDVFINVIRVLFQKKRRCRCQSKSNARINAVAIYARSYFRLFIKTRKRSYASEFSQGDDNKQFARRDN